VRPALWRGRGADLLGEVAYLDVDGTIVATTGQLKQGIDISYKGIWGAARGRGCLASSPGSTACPGIPISESRPMSGGGPGRTGAESGRPVAGLRRPAAAPRHGAPCHRGTAVAAGVATLRRKGQACPGTDGYR
jgi:hypothetical protein